MPVRRYKSSWFGSGQINWSSKAIGFNVKLTSYFHSIAREIHQSDVSHDERWAFLAMRLVDRSCMLLTKMF